MSNVIDFKVIVKVDPSDPAASAKRLGELVLKNPDAFKDIDPKWISSQTHITAVPIAVALTVEMRAVVQANSPKTKFIVTGVTECNVKDLMENFGYKVYPTYPVVDSCSESTEEKCRCDESSKSETPAPKSESRTRYFYDGKEVSEEEFRKRWQDWDDLFGAFRSSWKDFLIKSILP